MDVLVVGAGLSGLIAATELTRSGHTVVLVEKSNAVGGRMASKRHGEARFDTGAQHFSARSTQFQQAVKTWMHAGVVDVWYDGQSITNPERGVEPRYRGTPAMRSISEHLAEGLDVRLATAIDRVEVLDGRIRAVNGKVKADYYHAAVITAPAPQALRLVRAAPIGRPARSRLAGVEYQPSLAAMLVVDRPTGWNGGHVVPDSELISWMADNHSKGVSAIPAVTVHSTPEFASKFVDSDVDNWLPILASEAEMLLPGRILDAIGHRWRYAQPVTTTDDGALVGYTRPPIVFAGEAFAGARVEGAYLSGLQAAHAVDAEFRRQSSS